MPVSSYKLNYCSKENAPPFPPAKDKEHFNIFKQYQPVKTGESMYKSAYVPKTHEEHTNYKDLDCFKNKIT